MNQKPPSGPFLGYLRFQAFIIVALAPVLLVWALLRRAWNVAALAPAILVGCGLSLRWMSKLDGRPKERGEHQ